MVHARNGAPTEEAFNVWSSSGRSTIQPFFADAEDLTQEPFLSLFIFGLLYVEYLQSKRAIGPNNSHSDIEKVFT